MSAASHQVRAFVDTLRQLETRANIFNPWRDHDAVNDCVEHAPDIRAQNLTDYLLARVGEAKVVLVAEAPGYQGAKHSGIAMTSERILLNHVPEVPARAVFARQAERTSRAEVLAKGAAEPTATIVWKQLLSLGYAPEEFVLWNAFPCHPHKPGQSLTNRAPTPADMQAGGHVLPRMLALFPRARVVAVGNVAQRAIEGMGLQVPCVRHPANGGATKFRDQVAALPRS